jgi:hypothetical protein
MSIEQIEYLKAQVKLYHEKFNSVQPLIDCRVCDYYVAGYMPCTSTIKCNGDLWTRTKTVQIWAKT